ncbi:MAG: MerR family transcriptional regulator [Omnitrophica WOR_2 bacterium]
MMTLPEPPANIENDEPLYNIGVVSRITGISMATLRAWERRYHFPEAERSAGGHRLYTEKDILRLRWVKDRIAEGMQTSQAIHALHRQEERGHEYFEAGSTPIEHRPALVSTKPLLSEFQNRLIEALINRQLERADQVMGEALASSTPEDLILQIIGPTMAKIGDAWEQKEISVATEHFATNYLRQRLLMWMLNGPPPLAKTPVVLACAPNEWHEGSLLILGALLRRRRIPIIYLGQAVPLSDLAAFIHDLKPALVVIVAMTDISASELVEWPQRMPEIAQTGKPAIAYGGRIFSLQPEWQLRMAGMYLGSTIEEGVSVIERMV